MLRFGYFHHCPPKVLKFQVYFLINKWVFDNVQQYYKTTVFIVPAMVFLSTKVNAWNYFESRVLWRKNLALFLMLKQNVGFGNSICFWVIKKLKAGLSVDYQTFNLMPKSQNESFSIPNLTQNKRLCFESTNAPFS